MADTIERVELREVGPWGEGARNSQLMLYGDQSDGSSIVFYTNQEALLVNNSLPGECPGLSSMMWGSCYPDAPHIFIDDAGLLRIWGVGPRKFLFVPGDAHDHVAALLGQRAFVAQELADKTLFTDRPLK